jgi:4-carboxymuconolactone decarboxylase
MLPADSYPDSRNRLPLVRRDDLDADGRKAFDSAANDSKSLVGLHPELSAIAQPLNRYLRFGAGLDPRTVELMILATARLAESRFEWSAHEPVARSLGVSDAVIDAIRLQAPLDGVPPDDALVIRLVRESVADHRVTPETFAAAHARFGSAALVSYVSLIGHYLATAVLLTVFDQQLPEETAPGF